MSPSTPNGSIGCGRFLYVAVVLLTVINFFYCLPLSAAKTSALSNNEDKVISLALRRCDISGKQVCSTLYIPFQKEIDALILNSSRLLEFYKRSSKDFSASATLLGKTHLKKRSATAAVNFAELCTAVVEITEPFSFIKGVEGWQQVASTPQFPQRVTFQTEKCSRTNVPCRGVLAAGSPGRLEPVCIQEYARQTILTFNQTSRNIEPRYIVLPNACKCKLQTQSFASNSASASTEIETVVTREDRIQ